MTNMPPAPALRESEWRDPPRPPLQPTPLSTEFRAAGIAWLVSAGLIGYLALVQWQAADLLSAIDALTNALTANLGVPAADTGGEFRRLALLNGGQAALTLALGVRILRHPSTGLMSWSIALAVLSVAAGVLQLGSLVNPFFLGSIIAAVVAGWYSWQAR